MGRFKRFITFAAINSLLFACSQEATSINNKHFQIQGAFGLELGQQASDLPIGYIIGNNEFSFTPTTTLPYFSTYTFSITPKTHAIYGLKFNSRLNLAKQQCLKQQQQLIEQTLAQYDTQGSAFNITIKGYKWTFREKNQREISIGCERSLNAKNLQLVMIYQDTALSLLAYKEWTKRPSDITKPPP